MLLFDDTAGSENVKLRAQKDLMFKALNDETARHRPRPDRECRRRRDDQRRRSRTGGRQRFTLSAEDGHINVGLLSPSAPDTQIKMDNNSITLNVGIGGMFSQIVMNRTGITLNVGPAGALSQITMDASGVTITGMLISKLMVQGSGITTMTPTLTFGIGPAIFTSQVTIPIATIGAGTVGPLPLL